MSRQSFDVGERLLLGQLPAFKVGHLGRQGTPTVGTAPAAADPLGRAVTMTQASG